MLLLYQIRTASITYLWRSENDTQFFNSVMTEDPII